MNKKTNGRAQSSIRQCSLASKTHLKWVQDCWNHKALQSSTKPTKTVRRLLLNPKEKLKKGRQKKRYLQCQMSRLWHMLSRSNWKRNCCKNAWTQTCHKKTWSHFPNIRARGSERKHIQPGHGFRCGPVEHKTFKRVSGSLELVDKFRQQAYRSGLNTQSTEVQYWNQLESEARVATSRLQYLRSISVKGRLITALLESMALPKLVTQLNLVALLVEGRIRNNLQDRLNVGSRSNLRRRYYK